MRTRSGVRNPNLADTIRAKRMRTHKRQHYVPQSYLKRFAPETSPDALHVFDLETGNKFIRSVVDIAQEFEYYKVEFSDDTDPLIFEKSMAETVEAAGINAMRFIDEHRCLPTGTVFDEFVEYVALQYCRVPAFLSPILHAYSKVMEQVVWYKADDKKFTGRLIEAYKKVGMDVAGMTHEQERDQIRELKWKANNNAKIGTIADILPIAQRLLRKRTWKLLEFGNDCPNMLCSDNPVSIDSFRSPFASTGLPATLALPGTALIFPIAKKFAVLALTDSEDFPSTMPMDARLIAAINATTINSSVRFVYSDSPDFSVAGVVSQTTGLQYLKTLREKTSRDQAG